MDTSPNILQQAEKIIYGNRENDYGRPESNLGRIAEFWNVYLKEKSLLVDKKKLIATDVALLMVLLKCARLINNIDHYDSLVDICGYSALIDRIHKSKIESDNVFTENLDNCGDI